MSTGKSTWKPECAARMGCCHGRIPWLHHFSDVVRTSRIQAGLFLHNCSSVVRTTPFPASDLRQMWCNHGIPPWPTPIAEKAPSCTLWFSCTLGTGMLYPGRWILFKSHWFTRQILFKSHWFTSQISIQITLVYTPNFYSKHTGFQARYYCMPLLVLHPVLLQQQCHVFASHFVLCVLSTQNNRLMCQWSILSLSCVLCCVVLFVCVCMQYDEYKNPMDNIGMQDSLISRFDLLFVVLDEVMILSLSHSLSLSLSHSLSLSLSPSLSPLWVRVQDSEEFWCF